MQEELKIDEDQAKKLTEALDKVREDNKEDFDKLRDRDTKPERGDDVVLAVKHYREDRDSKCREDNDSPFE